MRSHSAHEPHLLRSPEPPAAGHAMAAEHPPTHSRVGARPLVNILWEDSGEEGEEASPCRAASLGGQSRQLPAPSRWCRENAQALHTEYGRRCAALRSCQKLSRSSTLLLCVEEKRLVLDHGLCGADTDAASPPSAAQPPQLPLEGELCSRMPRCSLRPAAAPTAAAAAEHHVTRRMGALQLAAGVPSFTCPKCGHVFGLRRTRDIHKARCTA